MNDEDKLECRERRKPEILEEICNVGIELLFSVCLDFMFSI
jgi:hypothetical protein